MQSKLTNKSFEGQSFYVGIDVHKKSWQVTIMTDHHEHKTMHQPPSAEKLSGYLHRNFPGGLYQAVYEAGFSGFQSCRSLNKMGVDCMVVHPADVPTTHREKLQKTDSKDSRKLARMLRGKQIEPIDIPPEELEADRLLVRQRFQAVKDLSRTKNRVKSLLLQFGIEIPDEFSGPQTRHWSKAYTSWLKEIEVRQPAIRTGLDNLLRTGERQREELLIANRQLRELTDKPMYKDNYKRLVSIPGVGIITALTFLVQIGDIRRFPRLEDLCSYIGLVPQMRQSGERSSTGGMVKRGRKELKVMLIEAAWDTVRVDPAMMARFNELCKKMPKNKAIIRITRKLVSRIRHILLYQEDYQLNKIK